MTTDIKTQEIESLTSIIDSTPVSIQIISPEGVFLDCNKATYTLYGINSQEDVIGRSASLFFPKRLSTGEISEEAVKKYSNQALSGKTVTFDCEQIRTDGEVFPVQVTLQPVTYNQQKCLLITVIDVSVMYDKSAWYESILDAVQFPIHVTDMDRKWTYMNKSFEDVLLKNKVIKDRKSAYGLPCYTADATICRTENCGIEQLQKKGVTESYFEWQGMTAKQITKPVMNARGEQVGYVETVEDLTEHLNRVAWYESILDAVQFPIHVTDMDRKWTYMNTAFEAVLLKNKVIKDRKSAYGLPCYTADATICRTENCGIEQLQKKGITESYFEWQGMNGKQVTKPVLNARGEQVGYVETVQDMTEQLSVISYLQREVDHLGKNLKKLASGDTNCDYEVETPDEHTKEVAALFV
ncbi:MAG: PAS domain S-box protein, partial [Methanospirillum sp.]|uniref:PAS domain-containing protein n=1 Tax=Methanospirillum sp. TaxID=45200 RepID=UPI00236B99E7